MGIKPSDLDYVLMTHLDCDHANGLRAVKDAKNILVARDEYTFSRKKTPTNLIRYQKSWWDGVNMTLFDWNDTEEPFGRSPCGLSDQKLEEYLVSDMMSLRSGDPRLQGYDSVFFLCR